MNCFIADHTPDFFIDQAKSLGFNCTYSPVISNHEFQQIPDDYQAVLIKSALQLDANFLSKHPSIKYIFRPGSGLDNIDLIYCKQHHINVISTPEGNCNAVAEHVIGMLLNMSNNLYRAISQVKNKEWIREPNRGFELFNKSIAVIGVGNTGSHLIKRLAGFEMQILPHDKYLPFINSVSMPSVSLSTVYEKAEIVSLHLPLTVETKNYADDEFFESFDKPIYFINASRGKVLDTSALVRAIKNGKVIQASLDVLENEQLETYSKNEIAQLNELIDSNKVFITPHIAGWTFEAKEKMFAILLKKYNSINV